MPANRRKPDWANFLERSMSGEKSGGKAGRPSRTLDEEIAAAESRVAQLKAKKREDERRKLEQNQKAIMALVKSAGLDAIEADVWEKALPKLKELLETPKPARTAKPAEAGAGNLSPAFVEPQAETTA